MASPGAGDLVRRGWMLLDLKRPREALAAAGEALAIAPEDADAHLLAGAALLALDRIRNAEEHAQTLLRIDPEGCPSLLLLGRIRMHRKDLDGAEALFRDAARVAPRSPEPHVAVSASLLARNEPRAWREAQDAAAQALSIDPRCTAAYVNLGIALRELGNPEDALESYLSALRIDPEDPFAHVNRALLLRELGDFAGAADAFAQALRRDPLDPDVQAALDSLGAERYAWGRAISWPYRALIRVWRRTERRVRRWLPARTQWAYEVRDRIRLALFLAIFFAVLASAIVVGMIVRGDAPEPPLPFAVAAAAVCIASVVGIGSYLLTRVIGWVFEIRGTWRRDRLTALGAILATAVGTLVAIRWNDIHAGIAGLLNQHPWIWTAVSSLVLSLLTVGTWICHRGWRRFVLTSVPLGACAAMFARTVAEPRGILVLTILLQAACLFSCARLNETDDSARPP